MLIDLHRREKKWKLRDQIQKMYIDYINTGSSGSRNSRLEQDNKRIRLLAAYVLVLCTVGVLYYHAKTNPAIFSAVPTDAALPSTTAKKIGLVFLTLLALNAAKRNPVLLVVMCSAIALAAVYKK